MDATPIQTPTQEHRIPSQAGGSTPYERRVRMVWSVIKEHSELDDEAAEALARHVLYALDHVPVKS